MHKDNKTTKDPFQSRISKVLEGAKSNVFRQAALAIVTILLALVLISLVPGIATLIPSLV